MKVASFFNNYAFYARCHRPELLKCGVEDLFPEESHSTRIAELVEIHDGFMASGWHVHVALYASLGLRGEWVFFASKSEEELPNLQLFESIQRCARYRRSRGYTIEYIS